MKRAECEINPTSAAGIYHHLKLSNIQKRHHPGTYAWKNKNKKRGKNRLEANKKKKHEQKAAEKHTKKLTYMILPSKIVEDD